MLRSCPRPGSPPETTSGLRAVRKCARPEHASAFSGCADAPPSRVKITWPTLIFSPSLTLNLLHRAGHRRRHFDHRLVGFQFHDRLAFGNFGARRNHQPHQIALIDVLAQFGQLEFGCAGRRRGWRRRGAVQAAPLAETAVLAGAAAFAAGALASLLELCGGSLGLGSFDFRAAPFSTVKITWPTLIFWPSLTRISLTVPVTEEGTSTTALSVSSSITAGLR